MNINVFTLMLRMISLVFSSFQPLQWILCLAILCSIATIIKSIIGGAR